MTASAGENVRLAHQLKQMRACLDAFETALRQDVPILETAQVVADSALRLATTAARRDALMHNERAAPPPPEHASPPPGFLPCTRKWPHNGPCAHPPARATFDVCEPVSPEPGMVLAVAEGDLCRAREVSAGNYEITLSHPILPGNYVIESVNAAPDGELRMRRIGDGLYGPKITR